MNDKLFHILSAQIAALRRAFIGFTSEFPENAERAESVLRAAGEAHFSRPPDEASGLLGENDQLYGAAMVQMADELAAFLAFRQGLRRGDGQSPQTTD